MKIETLIKIIQILLQVVTMVKEKFYGGNDKEN